MAYAAEGFTKGFLGTIQGLTALERAQLEAEDFRERRARAQQFRDITAEELGRVGQLPQTSTGAIQGAVSAPPQMSAIPATEETPSLRQTAGIQEGVTRPQATTTTPVSRQDAMLRILERGMAVDPEKAFDITLKGLQLEDVLNTSKKKKEFQQWQTSFTAELGKLQGMAEQASTDPAGFMASAKKLGIDIRPVSVGGGKQVYEAYMGGRKMGQYDNLQTAAEDGIAQYTNNMFRQGAAQFATSIQDFGTLLQASQTMDVARRNLSLAEERNKREAEAAPGQRALTEAQTEKARADAANVGRTSPADTLRNNIALADQYRKQLSDIDTQLEKYPESSPQYAALARQRNSVAQALRSVNRLLAPAGGQAATTGGPDLEGARAAALSGKNPDTGKPYTKEEKAEYERIFGEPFPTAETAPAKPTRSALPVAPKDYGTLGRLTSQSTLEAAASQGNKSAIEELRRRREVETNRATVTPGYSPFGF